MTKKKKLRKQIWKKRIDDKAKGQEVIPLKCKKCKEWFYITINLNHKDLYTKKVKRNWTCLSCSNIANS